MEALERLPSLRLFFENYCHVVFPADSERQQSEISLPGLLCLVEQSRGRLEEVLRDRSHETLTRKAPQGKWSAQENAGHLLDLEPLWVARVADYLAARDQLTVADLTNQKTYEANHNARPIEKILIEFRAAREGLLLERVNEL